MICKHLHTLQTQVCALLRYFALVLTVHIKFYYHSFGIFIVVDVSVKKETGPPGKPCSLEQIKGKHEDFT